MKYLYLLIFMSIPQLLCAQQSLPKVEYSGPNKAIDSLAQLMIESLEDQDFYLVGEAHTFLVNNDFKFALIKALHKRGVYHIVNELPHVTCILFNEYLKNGDTTLLTQIEPKASYQLLQKIRDFNLQLPTEKRIQFYGIDYHDPRWDYNNFYLSLKLIRKNIPSQELPLDLLIDELIGKRTYELKDIKIFLNSCAKELKEQAELYQQHFGAYYNDLLLASSNMPKVKTDRDQLIFTSFKQLYAILLTQGYDSPKFLSFYGMGHLYNLGSYLENKKDSPVKAKVNRIAMNYLDCLGGFGNNLLGDVLYFYIKKKDQKAIIDYCKKQDWEIGIWLDSYSFEVKKKNQVDAMIFFKNYGDRKMRSWKFD